MSYQDRQRLTVLTAIVFLLVSLSLSLFQNQNINLHSNANTMGFNNPIFLFTNTASLSLLGPVKRTNDQFEFFNITRRHLEKFKYLPKVNHNHYFVLSKHKLLNLFQKYQLEGG